MTQKQLILQETFEAVHLAMDDLIGHASDLESVRFNQDAEDLREIIGHLENFIHRLRERHP
jgi:hypothetical protein